MTITAEIHFYSEDTAAVLLDIPSEKGEEFFAGLLFSLYTLRNLYNLGDRGAAYTLLSFLATVRKNINGVGSYCAKNNLKLIEYQGEKGEKGFSATLEYSDSEEGKYPVHFDLDTWGFGWLARDVGYYSPASVITLLRYLISINPQDQRWMQYLQSLCGVLAGLQRLPPTQFNRAALRLASEGYGTFYGSRE